MVRESRQIPDTRFTSYAAGTAYSLTATPAQLNFGTTDPGITITRAGTYLIFARARVDLAGATFAAVKTATMKLRRVNNTAGDLTNASAALLLNIVTTLTGNVGHCVIPPVIYTTTNIDDQIQLFGSVSELPAVGTVDVTEAEIIAIPI